MADGVHQVGLAQPHPSVQEERVVHRGGPFRHRAAGGHRQRVVGPDDEALEGVPLVQVGAAPRGEAGARRRLGPGVRDRGQLQRGHRHGRRARRARDGDGQGPVQDPLGGALEERRVLVLDPIPMERAGRLDDELVGGQARRPSGRPARCGTPAPGQSLRTASWMRVQSSEASAPWDLDRGVYRRWRGDGTGGGAGVTDRHPREHNGGSSDRPRAPLPLGGAPKVERRKSESQSSRAWGAKSRAEDPTIPHVGALTASRLEPDYLSKLVSRRRTPMHRAATG